MSSTIASRGISLAGIPIAVLSAAVFALSGTFASALIDAGWTPGAAVTARVGLAAIVLLVPSIVMMRGRWALLVAARWKVLLFGLVAVAGCQLSFFMAVQFIAPSLALLLEFLGPVLLVGWHWARSRQVPATLTLVGAGIAVVGVLCIAGIGGDTRLHPLGILFGLGAAVGVACYFAASADARHGVPPVPFAGFGLAVGALALGAASAVGLLPFRIGDAVPVVAGRPVDTWVVLAGLVLLATVIAYVSGILAARRLGPTVASFVGYSEPMFGIIWTALLLGILPTPMQWVGAAAIVGGVVLVRLGELRAGRRQAVMTEPLPIIEAD